MDLSNKVITYQKIIVYTNSIGIENIAKNKCNDTLDNIKKIEN